MKGKSRQRAEFQIKRTTKTRRGTYTGRWKGYRGDSGTW